MRRNIYSETFYDGFATCHWNKKSCNSWKEKLHLYDTWANE